MRQENPASATGDLFRKYIEFAKQLKNVTLVNLLPVEHESRKIPQSGQYKGQNYFGNIELRKALRYEANKIIFESGLPYLEWPSTFLDDKGNLSFDIMEPKQSVHIRPKYYMNEVQRQLTLF